MTLFTEQKLATVDVDQTDMLVLDEAAWAEVGGGKIPEHFHGCPQIDNNPDAVAHF
ncbi:MAG: hypothetical protein JO142_10220 [Burkholderiales bacterium]|nr:hypothetical protein [Burkholderiales bacterium]